MTPASPLRARGLVVAAGLTLLAACGGGTESATGSGSPDPTDAPAATAGSDTMDMGSETPSEAASGEATLGDAEVTFLQGMIPHHAQATEMAALVADRTERPELRDFAERIISAQGEEITTMRGLLEAAGEDPAGMDGMDTDGMDTDGMDMPGMASGEEMAALEEFSGEEFDLAFLDAMTAHHQGALEMARTVLDADPSPEVEELASQIAADQEGEIAQMDRWRQEWAA